MNISWFSRREGAFYLLFMSWGENLLPQVLNRQNRRSLNVFGVNDFRTALFSISKQGIGDTANASYFPRVYAFLNK